MFFIRFNQLSSIIRLSGLIAFCCFYFNYLITPAEAAATIQVIYGDDAGEGFNDTTPANPVGGNTATTLGAQRKAALAYTINILEQTLSSDVPIKITATFSSLGGTSTSATLASAGPNTLHFNFDHAPLENTYYAAALANKLAGQDLDPESSDVFADFNTDIDTDAVLGSTSWYYGFDGKPSNNNLDFVSVALHELLHGMGFLSLVDAESGRKYGGLDDIFSHFLDRFNGSPSSFNSMTSQQRVSATQATDLLHWIGPITKINSTQLSSGVTLSRVHIYAPNPIESGSSLSHVSDKIVPHNLMEPAYVGVYHSLGIAAAMLSDIGWGPLANLSLVMQGPTSPIANTPFTLDFVVGNSGSETGEKVTFTYSIPAHMTVTQATPDQGSCTINTQSVSCSLGSLDANKTINVTLTANASSAATFTIAASVTGDLVDSNIANNTISESLAISSTAGDNTTPTDEAPPSPMDNSTPSQPDTVSTKTASGGTISWLFLIVGLSLLLLKRRESIRRLSKN